MNELGLWLESELGHCVVTNVSRFAYIQVGIDTINW